jgi:hypothetical protein
MSTEPKTYDRYPAGIVILSAAVTLATYGLGAFGLGRLWPPLSVGYLAYCLWTEDRILRHSCANCYYYGDICAFGRGKLCIWLYQSGDPRQFAKREVSWRDVVPDVLVLALPLVGGIADLVLEFTWLTLGSLVLLLTLTFAGNGFVRGSLACAHCKQRELGCPAARLFGGKEQG